MTTPPLTNTMKNLSVYRLMLCYHHGNNPGQWYIHPARKCLIIKNSSFWEGHMLSWQLPAHSVKRISLVFNIKDWRSRCVFTTYQEAQPYTSSRWPWLQAYTLWFSQVLIKPVRHRIAEKEMIREQPASSLYETVLCSNCCWTGIEPYVAGFRPVSMDYGGRFNDSSPAYCLKIGGQLASTNAILLEQGTVQSRSESWDDSGRAFPDELRVGSFPWLVNSHTMPEEA